MKWSESTKALDAALAKSQAEIQPVIKNAVGGGWSYAGLEEVMEKAQAALSANGITINQGGDIVGDKWVMVTRLAHAGEWLITYLPMDADSSKRMNSMQQMGSGSTYARRYAIQCALGIAPLTEQQAAELGVNFVDDDAASSGKSQQAGKIEEWCKQHGFDYEKLNAEALRSKNLNVDRLKDKDLRDFQSWLMNANEETRRKFK